MFLGHEALDTSSLEAQGPVVMEPPKVGEGRMSRVLNDGEP